ncbi:MAG: sarcosine oxidase subunit gamma family protein [Steroidobacterales bacterium]
MLPEIGRSVAASQRLAICVRPERWLLLHPTAASGSPAAVWESAVADNAAVVDLSSALTLLRLTGPAVREMLARGCRLDLDPAVFAAGHAAATIIAQVSVILVALSSGMLLVTPSTTARHFSEWLAHTATPFGFETEPEIVFDEI